MHDTPSCQTRALGVEREWQIRMIPLVLSIFTHYVGGVVSEP